MVRRFARKRRAASLALLLLLLLVGGVAVAYFTSGGSGSGHASVGSATNFTVNVSTDDSGVLFPGAGSETLTYTVHNGGTGHQSLSTTSAAVASLNNDITQGGIEVPGCLKAWFSAANTAPTPLPQDLAGGADSSQGTVVVTMSNAATIQDACQGHKPDITVTAS